MNDVVYILDNVSAEDLKRSLSSVKENLPHRKIWFYGFRPNDAENYVEFEPKGVMPWEKEISTIYEVCRNDEITDDFWLFNGTFEFTEPAYDKTMWRKIQQLKKSGKNAYQLKRTRESLQAEGYTVYNFETQAPMLINRKKARKLIETYPKMTVFRSTYGNMHP